MNCQVVTLSEKLVVLTLCFKNRTQCCCAWVFLGNVPHFADFQQITEYSCSKKKATLFVHYVRPCGCKVEDSCCATVSCAQTLLVPSSYKQDIRMLMAHTSQSSTINAAPQALCTV